MSAAFLFVLAFAQTRETEVITAAMLAYFNQMHGIGARGFVSLYSTSVKPTRRQLRVAVFSPENADASRLYASSEVRALIDDLMTRNARPAQIQVPHFEETSHHRAQCSGESLPRNFIDALAVSRPGFSRGDKALVYLEYAGGARAYYLVLRKGHWEADWYVDLWQCG